MVSLTLDIDDEFERRLRLQTGRSGRSMQEDARRILDAGLRNEAQEFTNAAAAIAAIVDPIGGIELDLPSRKN